MRRARSRRSSRRADREHRGRSAEPRQRDGAEPDRAHALHQHRVARPQRRALENVDCGQQAASAADVVVERHAVRQPRDADARLEIDRLRPSAEQSLRGRIGDAVDPPRDAARRCPVHRAGAAAAAGAVDVEEHRAIALAQAAAVDARQRAAHRTRACRPRRGRE